LTGHVGYAAKPTNTPRQEIFMGKQTAAALLAASALLVAACGDDGDAETGGEDVEEPGAPEETGADDDADDDEGEAAGGGGDFCDEHVDFSRDWGISDIHDDPAGYGTALGELEAVPEKIAEDVQTLLDKAEVVVEVLDTTADDSGDGSEAHDDSDHDNHDDSGDGSEAHDDVRNAMEAQELQQMIQEIKDADDAITGWVENNCAT
jgi:hypothetical protein